MWPKPILPGSRGCVDETDAAKMKEGLDIGEKRPTLPAELVILKAGDISEDNAYDHGGKIPSGKADV